MHWYCVRNGLFAVIALQLSIRLTVTMKEVRAMKKNQAHVVHFPCCTRANKHNPWPRLAHWCHTEIASKMAQLVLDTERGSSSATPSWGEPAAQVRETKIALPSTCRRRECFISRLCGQASSTTAIKWRNNYQTHWKRTSVCLCWVALPFPRSSYVIKSFYFTRLSLWWKTEGENAAANTIRERKTEQNVKSDNSRGQIYSNNTWARLATSEDFLFL